MRARSRGSLLAACLALAACRATVRGGLSEPEANQIVVALDAAAIAATKVAQTGAGQERFLVEVATSDATRALRVIETQRLPRATEPGFADLYRETGLVATPHEERARWAAATAGELSRSLAGFPNVLDARVHLAVAEMPRTLDAERARPRASVLIQRRRGSVATDESQVRALVAGAVEGLSADAVTVVQITADPPASPRRAFVRIGPITVTSESARALKALLGSTLALDLVMAVALVALLRRVRRGRA